MKYVSFLATLLMICFNIYSQENTVSGRILAFKEIPVINATVTVQGSGQKVSSDSLGAFTIKCDPGDKLVVTAEGFIKKSVKAGRGREELIINIALSSDENAKEKALANGHVKDKEKLYAIASHDNNSIEFSHYRNIYDIIESNFTGVQVINGEVIVRNSNSFSGSNPALLIVDGREVSAANFGALATADIANVNILKDGSAAVYGVRGANGVVIVETKRGGK